uniref:Laminin EGF-like domain-containing protein n=1 Tax=Periophthalmus magnuspinnatus TaxID=409849 RepID=A0A3B3ZMC1_9GOBI
MNLVLSFLVAVHSSLDLFLSSCASSPPHLYLLLPECDCSGRSDECVFDMDQYRGTGSGGRCLNCRDNTDGPHCERCKEDHYRSSPEDVCLPCNCNINGSVTQQCDQTGSCVCKEGVTGEKCDTCTPGFHSLGLGGCRRSEGQ